MFSWAHPLNILITAGLVDWLGLIVGTGLGLWSILMSYGGRDIIRKYIRYGLNRESYSENIEFDFETICSLSEKELFFICYLAKEIYDHKVDHTHEVIFPIIVIEEDSPHYSIIHDLYTKFWVLDSSVHKADYKNENKFLKHKWFHLNLNMKPFQKFLNPENKLWKIMRPTNNYIILHPEENFYSIP